MLRVLELGAVSMILADAVVGVRLLAIAWRTRRLPEAALGAAFVLLGAVGYPLATAARRGALPSASANAALLAAGFLAQNLGCLGIYLHVACTFRLGSRAAPVATALAALLLAASWVGQGFENGFHPNAAGAAYYLGLVARAGGFVWAAFESLRFYGRSRRRLRLGLADPVVTNRFLLFGVASVAVFVAFAVFLVGRLTSDNVAETTWVLAATGAVGVIAAATTWLAFLPPAAYRRRIAGRARATA